MDNSQDIRDLLDGSLSPVLTPEDLISSIGSSSTQILDENQLHDVSFASVSTINSQSRSTDVQHAASTGFSKISIKRRLLKGDGEFILVQHIGNSDVWKKFKNVMHIIPCPDDPDSPEQSSTDFVACVSCMELYGKTTSTATLGRHKCRMTLSQNTIETYGVFKNKKRLPTHVKDETINKCVKYCSLDIRPMSAIKGLGFCEISQFFLDTGAKYGYTDLNDILPHPTTVSRHIISIATKIRKIFFKEVYSLIDGKYCASTCDMWTDNYKKNNYMTITIHFIDDQWLLHNRILYTGQYPSHETKTGENIKKFMINAFTQLTEIAEGNNSSELMDNLTFVTDQGTNIVNALRSFKRLNCSAHLINTVLRNLFDIKFLSHTDDSGSIPLQPIIHLFNECKNLVKFMKSSGKNSQLSTVLVQEVETRWNTRLLMLESIEKSLPEIIKIHGEFFCRLQNINRDLLQSLITFLKIFKNASDELEGDKKPTIQKVVLFKCLIKNNLIKYANLEINNLDEDVEVNIDSIMKILGNKALTILDNKFQLSDVHEIAVFLWPKFKMLKMFSEENGERSRILGDIELRVLKFEIEDGEKRANSVTETNINSNSQELTSKEATMFSEWEDGVDERAQQSIYKYKKELESYREENYDISDDQILDFCMDIENEQLVKDALQESYYAPSSSSEEFDDDINDLDFEVVKNTTEADNLNGILCLNSDSECDPTVVEIDTALNTIEDSGDDLAELLNEPSTSTGKKRSNPSVWKRNVEKKNRVEGTEFISSYNKKIVKKRQIGMDCKCSRKCFSKFNDEEKHKTIDILNTIGSKEKQDTYICGLLNVQKIYLYCVVKSKRYGINNIIHRYPEPGHSFLPCDRSFGRIEKIRRKIERVYIPETYQEMVTKTFKKFQVVKVTQDIYDVYDDNRVDIGKIHRRGIYIAVPQQSSVSPIESRELSLTSLRRPPPELLPVPPPALPLGLPPRAAADVTSRPSCAAEPRATSHSEGHTGTSYITPGQQLSRGQLPATRIQLTVARRE
ncbi:hypothetical protein QTP88_006478 [Uroleucon formosanum]